MIKRQVSKSALQELPYLTWNAFVDLLAMEDEKDLTETQKIAHYSFWYDAELQNGGHLQYFENRRRKDYTIIIESLIKLGALKQADVMKSAVRQFKKKNRPRIISVFEIVRQAREGEYDVFDTDYYHSTPDITTLLEKYLHDHFDHFIELID